MARPNLTTANPPRARRSTGAAQGPGAPRRTRVSTLDGFGSYDAPGDWGGYWGKHGPELLEHRLDLYSTPHHMVFGATTMRVNLEMFGPNTEGAGEPDPWVERMRAMPTTVISSTMNEPLDWPDVAVVRGDAVEVIARLKAESDVPPARTAACH